MEKLFYYTQTKKGRKLTSSECHLSLEKNETEIVYFGSFLNIRSQVNKSHYIYTLKINLKNGNIIINKIVNENDYDGELINLIKKNNFLLLEELTIDGFIRGQKKIGFWGLKYKKALDEIFNVLKKHLEQDIEFIKTKDYSIPIINNFFDLLVDYHLIKRKIKFHDNVYYHILQDFPTIKQLKLNNNKFLPSLLDKYHIKSKFFIGQLSTRDYTNINIKVLSYVCKLFGENYMDYIKNFDWLEICKIKFIPKNFHVLRNESEKKQIIIIIQNCKKKENKLYEIVEIIYKLLDVREYLEKRGFDLKLKIKTPLDMQIITEEWLLFKKEFIKGYSSKINFPPEFINEIEKPIIINNITFTPRLLQSESDFIMEGFRMKNCMGKQFNNGKIYFYFSLTDDENNECVNLQFKKKDLVQAYSKANTPINKELFNEPIKVLSNRLTPYSDLELKIEKYEI